MSTTTVLPFAGGELSSFDPLDASCIEITNAGTFNSARARCSIAVESQVTGCYSPKWAAAHDFWFHVNFYHNGGSEFFGETHTYKFFSAGVEVLWINTVLAGGGVTVKPYTLQAGVMTNVGSFVMSAGLEPFDVRLVDGAAGVVEVYVAGTQRLNVTGLNHSGFSGVDQVFLGPTSVIAGNPPCHSEVICDTVSHVGDALVTLVEDTASLINTGWSGAVSAINELVLDDSHSVTSSAGGDVGTYYKAGASLGSYKVVAICVGVRAQLTAGSSTNLQIALRTNGSNYFGPTMALGFGFQAVAASWTQNPFTAAAWDTVTAAAVEVGMKSVA